MSKGYALPFLVISLSGSKGKKSENLSYKTARVYLVLGPFIYAIIFLVLYILASASVKSVSYFLVIGAGYLLFLRGDRILSRIMKDKLRRHVAICMASIVYRIVLWNLQ